MVSKDGPSAQSITSCPGEFWARSDKYICLGCLPTQVDNRYGRLIRPGLCADRVADWLFVVCIVAYLLRRIMKILVKVVWLMEAREILGENRCFVCVPCSSRFS